jgi:hypothetical protein
MAKAQGPEEFFEALRAARSEEQDALEQPAEPAPKPSEPLAPRAEDPAPAPPPLEPIPAPMPRTQAAPAKSSRFPLSVFADNEPTIAVRRSTIIFALLIALVLIFIAYAVGLRAGKKAKGPARLPRTSVRGNLHEKREPAHPARFQNKYMVQLRVLDRTQQAGEANARKYRDTLQSPPGSSIIRGAGKEVVIMTYNRKLFVCVGPFDALDSPDLNRILPRLRALDVNFSAASVLRLPYMAKILI